MKAIFEVEFDPDIMADDVSVEEIGGWLAMMQWLYEQEGLGIFENELKLIEVKDSKSDSPVIK